jgi:hypothetical protein
MEPVLFKSPPGLKGFESELRRTGERLRSDKRWHCGAPSAGKVRTLGKAIPEPRA